VQISEVRIKLMGDAQDRLLAFCSITFDGSFVIRDLKIIKGLKGPFVAMPSRKLTDRCPKCGTKNALRSNYCNQCGLRQRDDRAIKGQDGRAKLYADIAHPINTDCREMIQDDVIAAFNRELVLAQQPGYQCRYDEFDDGMMDDYQEWAQDELRGPAPRPLDDSPSRSAPASRQLDPHRRLDAPMPASGPHDARTENSRVTSEEFGEGLL
jgi:stage V sporulation protein G